MIPVYLFPGGNFALDGVAIRSQLLGLALGLCGCFAGLLWTHGSFWQLPAFVGVLSLFHFLEYYITARFNTPRANLDAFLLSSNGRAYNIAHSAAFLEALVEWFFFPLLKGHKILIAIGIVLIIIGQVVRALAMAHAATNFNHQVATRHEQGHVLVKTGVYSIWRHPSYFGFFWWGLGTQMLLGNPVCFVGYTLVLWKFFSSRISREEEYLTLFFGKEYIDYRAATKTWIPLI